MKRLRSDSTANGSAESKKASEYVVALKRHVKTYSWVHEMESFHRSLNKREKKNM